MSRGEQAFQLAGQKIMTFTGIKHWNVIQKSMMGAGAQNRMIDVIAGYGDSTKAVDRQWIHGLGLDQTDIKNVRKLIDAGVIKKDKTLWQINTERWMEGDFTGKAATEARFGADIDRITGEKDKLIAEASKRINKRTGKTTKAAEKQIAGMRKSLRLGSRRSGLTRPWRYGLVRPRCAAC
jgi:hypothetical protein